VDHCGNLSINGNITERHVSSETGEIVTGNGSVNSVGDILNDSTNGGSQTAAVVGDIQTANVPGYSHKKVKLKDEGGIRKNLGCQ